MVMVRRRVWVDVRCWVSFQEDRCAIFTLALLEGEKGVHSKTAHEEFLPQSECLDVLRTTSRWEATGRGHEGGVSAQRCVERIWRYVRWVDVGEGCGRQGGL